MKFVDPGPLADPAAARKLLELAQHAVDPVQDGRISDTNTEPSPSRRSARAF
jgi:hypothetical protein